MDVIEGIFALIASALVLYGIPVWAVARDQNVPYGNKIVWFIAILLFSWVAFLIFLLLSAFTGFEEET